MPPNQHHRFRFEWGALALVLGIVGSFAALSLVREHHDTLALAGERLQRQAEVVNENLIRQLQGADKALEQVRDDLRHQDPAVHGAVVSNALKSLTEAIPGISNMLLQDRTGLVVAASDNKLIGKHFAERAYFKAPRSGADPAVLYVSPPFRSVLGTFVMVVGHVVTDSAGEFAGVVSASLDPAYFDVVIRSVLYAPDMHSTLIIGDGKVFVDTPPGQAIADLNGANSPFAQFRREAREWALLTGVLYQSGEKRVLALRSMDRSALQMDQPMLIVVSRDLGAIERPWRARVVELGSLFVLLSVGLGSALMLDHRRRDRASGIAAAVEQERALAAAALRDSEDQLREMTDKTPALVARLDIEERFRFANRAFRDWLHLEPADLIGRSLNEVYGDAIYATFARYIARVLEGEQVVYERDMQVHDGIKRVEVTLIPHRADDGAVRGFYALITDISARFEADQLRARSEERLTLALEGSGQALFDWDIANDRMYQSSHAAVMRGRPPQATVMSRAELRAEVHPDDIDHVLAQIADIVSGATSSLRADFRLARADGDWLWMRAQGRVVERGADRRARRIAGTYADVSAEKIAEGQLRRLAEIDDLTGLPNRALFNERLDQALARVAPDRPLALLFLDIDHFKEVNDSYGHEAGDEVLKVCAARMLAVVRKSDTVARLAGDEFTIILEAMHDPQDALNVAGKLVERLRGPIALSDRTIAVTVSIGIAMCTPGDRDPAALLRRADAALYEAKRRGRDGFARDERLAAAVVG